MCINGPFRLPATQCLSFAMKKTILFAYTFLILGSIAVQAQIPANSSRLNLPNKAQTMQFDRTLVRKPTVLSYKPLALEKPQALNDYYRALLFAKSTPGSTSTTPLIAESSTTAVGLQVAKTDRRAISMERLSDDNLFSNEWLTVSNVYPNPASDYAEFDYTMKSSDREAKIIICNILGNPISEYSLDKNDRKLRINTRDMPTSVYFYRLAIDGNSVATKKLLVRHQQ